MVTTPAGLLSWAESAAAYGLASWGVQATLLLLAGLLLARLPRLRPGRRHAVLLVTLCLAALAPAGLVFPSSLRVQAALPSGLPTADLTRDGSPSLAKPRRPHAARMSSVVQPDTRPEAVGTLLRWGLTHPALTLSALGSVVIALRLFWLLLSAAQVASWVRRGRPLDRDRLYAACGYRVADIPVLETSAVQVPSVVGAWRPVILLPEGLSGRIDADALGHVLFHEEGHARRRDPLCRLLSALAETLLFWHPLVPLIRRDLETAAEDACDTHALERGAGPTAYARTLLSVLEMALASRSRPLTCRLGKRGSELKRRVTRILTGTPTASPVVGYLSLGAMLPALGAAAMLEVGVRPENPLGWSNGRVLRSSGSQVFRSAALPVSEASRVRAFKHRDARAPGRLNTMARPESLFISPGTWRALPGSVLVEEGVGALGDNRDVLPRRDHLTVFLLDISGPTTAQQLEARRQIMLRIEALPAGDRFNVVAFNSRVLPYASSPISPTEEAVAAVRSWLDVLPQEKGNGLAAGLRHALAHEGVTSVILFAGGSVSHEISSRPELLTVLERENRWSARIQAVATELPQQQVSPAFFDAVREPAKTEIRAEDRPNETELP